MTKTSLRQRSKKRSAFWGINALFVFLAALYLIAPGIFQWRAEATSVNGPALAADRQYQVKPSDVPVGLVQQLDRTWVQFHREPPPILTYHNIATVPGAYTVSPQQFADQMALLSRSGWRTLTAGQMLNWIHGGTLPAHSLLLTFDDGARGVWQYADPTLKRYNMHALAFIVTSWPGTHGEYYMTWHELQRMQQSGRWDLESHSSQEHLLVQIDAHGDRGGMLNNLLYNQHTGSQETLAHYTRRIADDLERSKAQLLAHGIPTPTFFAYPFSAYSSSSEVTSILHRTVTSLFAVGMLDGSEPHPTPFALLRKGYLERVDVHGTTTLFQFATDVLRSSALPVGAANPLSAQKWVDQATSHPVRAFATPAVPLGLTVGARQAEMLDPARTADWQDYTFSGTVSNLSRPSERTVAGVEVLVGSGEPVEVSVEDGHAQVRLGGNAAQQSLRDVALPPQVSYQLAVEVTGRSVSVRVDGHLVADLSLNDGIVGMPSGGVGIYAFRGKESAAVPTFHDLTVAPVVV